MQFSENWLRTLVDPGMATQELSNLLTMAGLEVEEVEPVAPAFSGVVVGHVLRVEKYPDADRLRACRVDVGQSEPLQIVCGAPNVREGLKVACACIGAKLPPSEGSDKPFEIKKGKLRGIESFGMLCSARELGLPEENDGLIELPEDAPVGRNIREYLTLDDHCLTIKLTPNRADCLSLLGVAREVSALTGQPLQLPEVCRIQPATDEKLPVKIEASDLCGRFAGRVVRAIDARAQTPAWMKEPLLRSGQRPISALVDITNYVMLELGQPSHVFDLDKIRGGLTVRWGQRGESLKLLNDDTVELDDWVGVIADDAGVESLAGIMGGDATAVTLDTQNIFLEAAFWHPNAIQGRARRYKFSSQASHRFERGVDYGATVECLERITQLVVEICGIEGKTVVGPIHDQIVALPESKKVALRTARAAQVIGVPLTDEKIAAIFDGLGLTYTHEPGRFEVMAPSYRFDFEIEEDLIEEVARIYGYDNIPANPPVAANVMMQEKEGERSLFAIRRQLADLDFQEVVNYSFVDAAWEQDFCANDAPIRLQNPIASQMSVMRSSLVGSLVENVRYNVNRQQARVRVFEIGLSFHRDARVESGDLQVAGFDQVRRVAAIAYGSAAPEQWGQRTRGVDFFDLKADLEALFAPRTLRFERKAYPALHGGRSAAVLFDGQEIGFIGELHPRWQQKYDLPQAAVVFEVRVDVLQQVGMPVYREVPRFPAVVRDLALVVDNGVSAQAVIDTFDAVKKTHPDGAILQAIVLFDEFRGGTLAASEKSLAFRCTLQDAEASLQDDRVDAVVTAFIATLEQQYSIKLRG